MVDFSTSLIFITIFYTIIFSIFPEFLSQLILVFTGFTLEKIVAPIVAKRFLIGHLVLLMFYVLFTFSQQSFFLYWVIGGILTYSNLYRKPLNSVDRTAIGIVLVLFSYFTLGYAAFGRDSIITGFYRFSMLLLFIVSIMCLFIYLVLSYQLGEISNGDHFEDNKK